ncbi:MAG: hypothetical protein ACJAZS_000824 [Alteromonas naphthalenivorans]|jgi:hypothetical protein
MIKHIYAFVFSFQFINFLWIMAVIGYLINKYVIPSIDQAMQAKEDAKTALKNVVSSTQEECKKVEDYSQEQKLYAQELLEKLKIWNAAVDITRAQETKHKQQGTRAITALVKKQEVALYNLYLSQSVTSTVMQDSKQKLTQLFSDTHKQQDFLNRALSELKQEKL